MQMPRLEITRRRSPWSLYGPFTPFRAKKDGSPYLRDETNSWRGFNGFMIKTKNWKVVFIFRRHGAFTRKRTGK